MIEQRINNEIDIWPLIVFSGTSGSGKTEFKWLLADELNREFDLTNIKAEASVFRWYAAREKRINENIDHIFVSGDTKEDREKTLLSMNLDYINRHPDNLDGNIYGWLKGE